MIREAISRVIERKDLDEEQMVGVMNEIMGGEATPAQIGSFITALRMKGETIPEIIGAARVMRARATPIQVGDVIDIDNLVLAVEVKNFKDFFLEVAHRVVKVIENFLR